MSRIAPLEPPYDSEVADRLAEMMPPGAPPISLFRTFAKNLHMTGAMQGWGSYELGRNLSLTMRDREILIDRTCARCGCEYEWSVHVAFFADRVNLTPPQLASIVNGTSSDSCWTGNRDRLLIQAADALHDSATIGDQLWGHLAVEFTEAQLLDLLMLCGWYHAIAFAANAAEVQLEETAPRFADVDQRSAASSKSEY